MRSIGDFEAIKEAGEVDFDATNGDIVGPRKTFKAVLRVFNGEEAEVSGGKRGVAIV